MTVRRETNRTVGVDPDTDMRLKVEYSSKLFRPAGAVETLRQGEDGWSYEVSVSGPAQTKTGKDHVANRGHLRFSDHGWSGRPIADLPSEIGDLLLGPDALAALALPTTDRTVSL